MVAHKCAICTGDGRGGAARRVVEICVIMPTTLTETAGAATAASDRGKKVSAVLCTLFLRLPLEGVLRRRNYSTLRKGIILTDAVPTLTNQTCFRSGNVGRTPDREIVRS